MAFETLEVLLFTNPSDEGEFMLALLAATAELFEIALAVPWPAPPALFAATLDVTLGKQREAL